MERLGQSGNLRDTFAKAKVEYTTDGKIWQDVNGEEYELPQEVTISDLDLKDVKVISISLVCQKEALEKRIQKDIDQGIRKPDVLARSVERLEMYQKLNTYKIDVSNKTIEEVVKEIIKVGDEND